MIRRASAAAGVAVALASFLWLQPSPVRADPPRPRLVEGDVTLDYRRGPGAASCPDEAALRERAADAFDFRDPFVSPGKQASGHLRVEIERDGRIFAAKVLVVDEAGAVQASSIEEHADCDALVWLLGHRMALAIVRRPQDVAGPAEAPRAAPTEVVRIPVPLPPPPCDARCEAERVRRIAPPPESAASLSFTAGGTMAAGFATDLAFGAWLGASVRGDLLSLGVELRGTFPARALIHSQTVASSVASASIAAVPCAHWSMLAGCLAVEVGPYFFVVPTHPVTVLNDLLLSAGPRLAVEVPIGSGFSARAFADLRLHPYLPVFGVRVERQGGTTFERWPTPVVSGLFGVGVSWGP
ncbi:MAG: hypothetical protein U0441_35445 [Polyangiaceae bacterium]